MAYEKQDIDYGLRFSRGRHFVNKPNEDRQSWSSAPLVFSGAATDEGARYYWNLNGTSHGLLNSPVSSTASWSLKCKVLLLSISNETVISSSNEDSNITSWIRLNSTSQVSYRTNGVEVGVNLSVAIPSNEVVELEFSHNESLFSVLVNGALSGSVSSTANNVSFDLIGKSWFGNYLAGYLFDIYMSGITNQTYTTVNFPMDNYAPDNSYQFIDSDNGAVVQLYNAVPEDFTQTLP